MHENLSLTEKYFVSVNKVIMPTKINTSINLRTLSEIHNSELAKNTLYMFFLESNAKKKTRRHINKGLAISYVGNKISFFSLPPYCLRLGFVLGSCINGLLLLCLTFTREFLFRSLSEDRVARQLTFAENTRSLALLGASSGFQDVNLTIFLQ